MKILIVEDNPMRIRFFVKKMHPNTLVICTSAGEAIDMLSAFNNFDEIWLDHDLDGLPFVESEKDSKYNSGYTVAKWLANNVTKARVIIHSQNIYGSANIKAILPDAIQAPFNESII